jgi:hypothetical protein
MVCRGREKSLWTRKIYDVASPFDHRKLESEANTEKRSILLAGPFDRQYHTFNAARTEPAWDKDAAGENMRPFSAIKSDKTLLCANNSSPRVVILLRICILLFWFQIR